MKHDSPKKQRRSIRMSNYEYSQAGAYFITICTHLHVCRFGKIVDCEMQLNDIGKIVANEWLRTPDIRAEIVLDEWVVMPNHFHAIFFIQGDDDSTRNVGATGGSPEYKTRRQRSKKGDPPVAPTGPKSKSVGSAMAGFKMSVTKHVNQLRNTPSAKLWQRNYWERVVRNDQELNDLREYIQNNPAKWHFDKLNPDAHSTVPGP